MAKATTKASTQAASRFDALFGVSQGERSVSGGFKMLAHNRITVRPQVRRTFAPAEMEELRASIRGLRAQGAGIEGTGVLQALLVSPDADGYRLIAGERRFRATQSEALPEVPCIVVPAVSEGMTRLLQLTENAQRAAPPVLEEAQALRETMDEQKLSVRDAARLLGKDKGYIENRLRLLKMGPDLQEMVSVRTDTLQHARYIEVVADAALRGALVRAVLDEGIGAREVQRRIEAQSNGKAGAEVSTETGVEASANASQVSVRTDTPNASQVSVRTDTAPSLSQATHQVLEGARAIHRAVAGGSWDKSDELKAREALTHLREVLAEIERVLG